jgi:hypothetical protein
LTSPNLDQRIELSYSVIGIGETNQKQITCKIGHVAGKITVMGYALIDKNSKNLESSRF